MLVLSENLFKTLLLKKKHNKLKKKISFISLEIMFILLLGDKIELALVK